MQTVETGDEIEIRILDVFGRCRDELHPVVHSMASGMFVRLFYGWLVEVVADEAGVAICLGHKNCREANATADIGHLGPFHQFVLHALKGRQPRLHDIVHISRPKERARCAKQATCGVSPPHPAAGPEAVLNLRLSLDHRGHQIESAFQIDGAVLVDENHRLLG
ncbi:hypothetical protein D3C86_1423380 [compost metagenome]